MFHWQFKLTHLSLNLFFPITIVLPVLDLCFLFFIDALGYFFTCTSILSYFCLTWFKLFWKIQSMKKINISKFIFFPEISEPLTWTWYVISLTDDIVLYCLQLVGTSRLLLSWFYGLYIAVSFLNIDYIYLNFSNNNNKGKIWRSISL